MMDSLSIKKQLAQELGGDGMEYWHILTHFMNGKLVKLEFEELVLRYLNTPRLVKLHNALLLSILAVTTSRTPLTPALDAPKNNRKRKRQLPYQGPDDDHEGLLRSKRFKHTVIDVGRAERERLKALAKAPLTLREGTPKSELQQRREAKKPMRGYDEVVGERGIKLIWEGRDPPGTHLPLHLAQVTRAPTLQHINEKLNLISSQHKLSGASRQVASLMLMALESKIKTLVTHALTLNSTSRTITSITPADNRGGGKVLTVDAFRTTFALAPHALPGGSAAATRIAIMGDPVDEDDRFGIVAPSTKLGLSGDNERHPDDPRWQLLTILKERSGVKEVWNR